MIKKITDSTGVYYAKFYSDLNNNGIDDTTEEITVNFVTNIEEQIEPVTLHVGQRMQTPKLSHTDKVFMGWYTNPELTNKFGNDNMRDSITLYAKWENSEKVINESEKVPIIDKDVSDQVEKMLHERFKEVNEEKINRENPNETKTEVPNQVATGTTDNTNANKGVATNNNQKSDPHNTNSNTNHANPVASNPLGGSLQNGTKGKENGTSNSANSNKITAYTETKYVFKNKHIGEKYMVKFLDESGAFVSSLTLPYGRTIKLIDENEKAHEEYAVRQDTTITLDTERYVNKGSTFLGLDTRTVQVNATEITEIVPTTAKNSANSFLYKQEKKGEQKKEKHTSIWMMVCSGIAVVGIMIGIFFFLKKRKQKEKVQIKNPNL
ncbi:InlB B-repeat-containing protein [Bacillus cereus]